MWGAPDAFLSKFYIQSLVFLSSFSGFQCDFYFNVLWSQWQMDFWGLPLVFWLCTNSIKLLVNDRMNKASENLCFFVFCDVTNLFWNVGNNLYIWWFAALSNKKHFRRGIYQFVLNSSPLYLNLKQKSRLWEAVCYSCCPAGGVAQFRTSYFDPCWTP